MRKPSCVETAESDGQKRVDRFKGFKLVMDKNAIKDGRFLELG